MDAFFAAVELLRRPELRGRPVVVGGRGDPTQRGVVSTASYEARKFGIHSAMPLRTAVRRCPGAVFLPVDFSAYRPVSKAFKAALRELVPVVQGMGIDEAYLDASELSLSSPELGAEIQRRVQAATQLTCSVGIGPNKLLAKLASDMKKPAGVTILTEADVEGRVWPLPLRKLRGIGPKTARKLAELGAQTIGDVARLPQQRLAERLGPSHGAYLARASRGIGSSTLYTGTWEPKSHSRETTFQRDVGERAELEATVERLANQVVGHLKERGYAGRNVTVKLRYVNFNTYTRATTLSEATDDPERIADAARRCLGRLSLDKKVRLLGVRVARLERLASP